MWTIWQIEMLIEAWNIGLSMTYIEQEFGMSRQQVAGMVKRQVLIGRIQASRPGGYTGRLAA